MRKWLRFFVSGSVVAAVIASLASASAGERGATPLADAGPPEPTCIRVWPEARMRAYGYDHVVHVQNACTKDAVCSVATDVNPDAVTVTVPKASEVEVTTWLGSPAREFVPKVKCRLP
jgi:hypothetical protein